MELNLDITKPRYSEHIFLFLWPSVISRFHCTWAKRNKLSSHNAMRFKIISRHFRDVIFRLRRLNNSDQYGVAKARKYVHFKFCNSYKFATFQKTITLFAFLVRDALNLFFVMPVLLLEKKKWQKDGLVIPLEIIHYLCYLEVDFLECSLSSPGLVFGITSCKVSRM